VLAPQSTEQRGNGARIVDLGLAVVIEPVVPAEAIAGKLRAALAPLDRGAHAGFAAALRAADGAGAMVDHVERAVALHRIGRSADARR